MQDTVISRLHRAKGQIEAVERMYKEDKCKCTSLLQQIQAARAALAKVAAIILSDEARRCADEGKVEELESLVENLFSAL